MKLLPILLIFLAACGGGQIDSIENNNCKREVSLNEINKLDHLLIPISVTCYNCETNIVQDSINYWNLSYGTEIFYQGNENSEIKISFENFLYNEINKEPIEKASGIAMKYDNSCSIQLLITDYDQTATLKHELGHCIGFEHSNDFNSIMWYSAKKEKILTEEIKKILDCIIE